MFCLLPHAQPPIQTLTPLEKKAMIWKPLEFTQKLCFQINTICFWSTSHLSSTINRKPKLFLIKSCFQIVRCHSHFHFQPGSPSQTTNLDFQWMNDVPTCTWSSGSPTASPVSPRLSSNSPASSFPLMAAPFTRHSKQNRKLHSTFLTSHCPILSQKFYQISFVPPTLSSDRHLSPLA